MNESGKQCCSNPKQVLWTLGIFALFGFLALIFTGKLGTKNPENRAYMGEFSEETTKLRWANLTEVSGAQTALVDSVKVDAALAAFAKAPAKPTATEFVVPGSPTFLKQAEQQAALAPAAPAATAPSTPAPATPAAPAPTVPAPAAPQAAPATPAPAAPATPAPAAPATPAPAAPAAPAPTVPVPAAPKAAPATPAPATPAPAPAPK